MAAAAENAIPPGQSPPPSQADVQVPFETGSADFAQVWTLEETGGVTPVASVPDIPPGYAEGYGKVVFKSVHDIEQHFAEKTKSTFIQWFNDNVADRLDWRGKEISARDAELHFRSYWKRYLRRSSITLTEFISYMSVFINECGGDLIYTSEKYGLQGHPGISYLFDTFKIHSSNGRVWRKASYNSNKQNKSALFLFNNRLFNTAHKQLPLGVLLANSTDSVWDGEAYPQERIIR
jgi:hypothetical protein